MHRWIRAREQDVSKSCSASCALRSGPCAEPGEAGDDELLELEDMGAMTPTQNGDQKSPEYSIEAVAGRTVVPVQSSRGLVVDASTCYLT